MTYLSLKRRKFMIFLTSTHAQDYLPILNNTRGKYD